MISCREEGANGPLNKSIGGGVDQVCSHAATWSYGQGVNAGLFLTALFESLDRSSVWLKLPVDPTRMSQNEGSPSPPRCDQWRHARSRADAPARGGSDAWHHFLEPVVGPMSDDPSAMPTCYVFFF